MLFVVKRDDGLVTPPATHPATLDDSAEAAV